MKSLFYSRGKFSPVYMWVNLFLLLVLVMIILRFIGWGNFSDTLILGLLGFVVTWLGLLNYDRKNKNGNGKVPIKLEMQYKDSQE